MELQFRNWQTISTRQRLSSSIISFDPKRRRLLPRNCFAHHDADPALRDFSSARTTKQLLRDWHTSARTHCGRVNLLALLHLHAGARVTIACGLEYAKLAAIARIEPFHPELAT